MKYWNTYEALIHVIEEELLVNHSTTHTLSAVQGPLPCMFLIISEHVEVRTALNTLL